MTELEGGHELITASANFDVVRVLVSSLDSADQDTCHQILRIVNNIVAVLPECTACATKAGLAPKLVELAAGGKPVSFLRTVAGLVRDIGRSVEPDAEVYCQLLRAISELMGNTDAEILRDALWGLSYFVDDTSETVQMVLDSGVLPRLVSLLRHEDTAVQKNSLYAVANIAASGDDYRDIVLDHHVLNSCPQLLGNVEQELKKETLRLLVSLLGGKQRHIQAVIDAELVPVVIVHLTSFDEDVRRVAARALRNLASGGSPEQVSYLDKQGALSPLSSLMLVDDPETLRAVLETVDCIFHVNGPRQVDLCK